MKEQGSISFLSAVLMSINIIVGVGIYFGPQIMTTRAGSMSFLGWPLVALMLFPVIWGVALAARMFPGGGSFYNYCTQGINKTFGVIAIWAYLWGFIAVAATQILAFRDILVAQFPTPIWHEYSLLLNIGFVLTLALLNLVSVELISKIQSVVTIIKLLPMILVIVILPFYWDSSYVFNFSDVKNLGFAIPAAIFGYSGFESCSNISHMLKGGSQKAFGVILTGFFVVVSLYALFHLGVLHIMGAAQLAAQGVPAFTNFLGFESANVLWFMQRGLTVILLLSFANAVYGVTLSNITNFFNMAQEKLFPHPKKLTSVNHYNRPVYAIFIVAFITFGFITFIPTTEILLAISTLGVLTAYTLTLLAVARVQAKQKDYFKMVLTSLGFGSCGALGYFSWVSIEGSNMLRLCYASPLLIGVAVGTFLYLNKKK
ncbi:APC family permease [Candidatus Babeliales bacterium]|nr:APC family permease [Candidatus Babeliales bacterium]